MSARANQVTEAYLADCATPDSRLRGALAGLDVSGDHAGVLAEAAAPPGQRGRRGRGPGPSAGIWSPSSIWSPRCRSVASMGTSNRFRADLGIDDRRGAWMRRLLGDGPPPLYGRADIYYDGSSFKLLEFNIGSALGGVDMVGPLPKATCGSPRSPSSPPSYGLGYLDTSGELAVALRNAGKGIGAGEPVVAVLEGPGGMAAYGHQRRAIGELLCRAGRRNPCRRDQRPDLPRRQAPPSRHRDRRHPALLRARRDARPSRRRGTHGAGLPCP